MLDARLIREHPEQVQAALAKRGLQVDFADFLRLDEERRRLLTESETLRAERKRVSAEVARLQRSGQSAEDLIVGVRSVADQIKAQEARLAEVEASIQAFLAGLPNLPDEEVPPGGKESNQVRHVWGEQPSFNFPIKDHVALAEALHLVNYQWGAKLGGNGFWVYTGRGARLEWALLNYFVDSHLRDGYELILPPHILNDECGYVAGQFPKFYDDVFHLVRRDDGPGQFLIPTAETALVNLHRDEILPEAALPLKYYAYTPCYRSEIGGYRSTERGTQRGHQFNKVEMFQYTTPEGADAAHQELLAKAEQLVQGLGLHYRVSLLAAEDTSASMARTYDVEVWLPSISAYTEVSSVSNARDYQARRGNIRYRRADTGRPAFVNTLNASGLATSRLFPAILEQYQLADGSVMVPEALRHWVGVDVLR